jgi:hypothetical protein
MVEYGALNALLRDATSALQRAGAWAMENWLIAGGVLVVLLFFAFRRR